MYEGRVKNIGGLGGKQGSRNEVMMERKAGDGNNARTRDEEPDEEEEDDADEKCRSLGSFAVA